MALASGTRFGAFEVADRIGVGGMGEVYRATDTKLKRSVAVKALPESFADDADRLARFQREAEVLAALNHPNIAQIYGLEEADRSTVLIMELVEGPTLADRIKEGPLPPDEALGIARQVADALEAAHGRQIVHRDLKPANIKLKPDGTVKVLDFGISKPIDTRAISGGSPAMTTPAVTETGVILGTAAYMSPEQARGRPVDERTDIWAFGCLLFEMLTGQPAFGGEDVMLTLARVLDRDTDMSSMPGTVAPAVRHTIKLCLEKDPNKRIADIRDVKLALGGVFDTERPGPTRAAEHARPIWKRALPVAAAVLGTALILGATAWVFWPAPAPVTRFAYEMPAGQTFRATARPIVAVSPDGRQFVFNAAGGLYLRAMDELGARLIPGTEPLLATPTWSPDGQSVAYLEPLPAQPLLKRISVSGGASVAIADIDGVPYSIEWETDGSILFDLNEGIFRVSANGGTPELIIPSDDLGFIYSPELLPDSDTVLFTAARGAGDGSGQIVAQSLSTGERTVLISGGSDPRYLPTGHLVYAFEDGIFAVRFDADNLTVSGGAVPLIQGVMRTTGAPLSANFAVADNGTLVYIMGETAITRRTLAWVDREGREEVIDAPARNYFSAQLSPDGTRIALDVREAENDVWIWDIERKTLQRLTFDPGLNTGPTWSPDGERIAFSRSIDDTEGIFWQAADGSGVPALLIDSSNALVVASEFLPDGSGLLYTERPPRDIWLVPTDDPGAGSVLLQTPASETNTSISPDGRWIAFQSDESGQIEVYVRPFPEVETGRWQISTGGGTRPRWSRDGTELFYYLGTADGTGAVMAVPIESGQNFRAGVPRMLFEGPYVAPHPGRQTFDVSLDGQRFLMIKSTAPGGSAEQPQIVVVENWLEEVRRLVSAD